MQAAGYLAADIGRKPVSEETQVSERALRPQNPAPARVGRLYAKYNSKR